MKKKLKNLQALRTLALDFQPRTLGRYNSLTDWLWLVAITRTDTTTNHV